MHLRQPRQSRLHFRFARDVGGGVGERRRRPDMVPVYIQAVQSELHATVGQLAPGEVDWRGQHRSVIHDCEELLDLGHIDGLDNHYLGHSKQLGPPSLGSTIIQPIAHQPEVRQIRNSSDVSLRPGALALLTEQAHRQNVPVRVGVLQLAQQVLLHLLHGLPVIQQLIHQHDLVRCPGRGIDKLIRRDRRGDRQIPLLLLVLVRRSIHEIHRRRPGQHAAEV
mmetsp:Transcript_39230/g.94325  ORF Transcript_39230/g.94325 Transcript_39230/m.94325 type:complete len:222 (+) Transcript_39230:388-1053(+)